MEVPTTKRANYTTVPFDKLFLARVDAFLETPIARRLGMTSRPDFFKMAGIAVLSKFDSQYKELMKLFDMNEEQLRETRRFMSD